MSEDFAALQQTGGSEPAPSDNVGGKLSPEPVSPPAKESIRDTLSRSYDEVVKTKDAPKEEGVKSEQTIETEEQKAERLRNERGQFVKADTKVEVKTEIKSEPEHKSKVAIDPPTHWKGEQKLKWANVPNEIKAAIAEDAKARQQIEGKASEWDPVITPERRQMLQVGYGDEKQGLNQILATVEFSNRDPMGFLRWFAQTRGIDPGSLAPSRQEQPQNGLPPELQQYLAPVLNKVTTLEQQLEQRRQFEEQQFTQQMQQETQSFLSDHQKYPFAQDVRQDMARLMLAAAQAGQTVSLPEVYEQAVWANPKIRQRLLAEQRAQEQQLQQQQVLQKRSLASSVTGAPGTAQPVAMTPTVENPRDTVRRTLAEYGRV